MADGFFFCPVVALNLLLHVLLYLRMMLFESNKSHCLYKCEMTVHGEQGTARGQESVCSVH